MTSSRVRLRVCEAKSKASSASRNTKETTFPSREKGLFSVPRIFNSACERERDGVAWSPGNRESGTIRGPAFNLRGG